MLAQVIAGGARVGGGAWLGVSGAAGLAVWALATPAVMPSRVSTSTKDQRARKASLELSGARRCMFPLLHNSAKAGNLFRHGEEAPSSLFPRVLGKSPSPCPSPRGKGR